MCSSDLVTAAGGAGGGGLGQGTATVGGSGVANTGGGGGGPGSNRSQDWDYINGGPGGSGVVIIRYPTTSKPATTTGTVSIIVSAGYYVYKFTGSGTITF